MKQLNFVIFFTVFFTIYALGNYYIFIRGYQAIPKGSAARPYYVALFLFLALAYIAGRFLERGTICAASGFLIWTGSFWLGMMLYLLLGALFFDCIRLSQFLFHWYPESLTANYERAKQIAAGIVVAISVLLILAGYINALVPLVRNLEIDIPKRAGNLQSLRIALVSDIHLGTIISNSRLNRMIAGINALDPDIVLMAGDIVDEDLAPVIENNLGEMLRSIRSRYGIYAVTGNHEYIGGVEEAYAYLVDHRITMLRDTAVKIADSFYIVGREDRSIKQFTGGIRKTLPSIMADVDTNLPVILMDHQPYNLSDAGKCGADLQLSGHTHHGQMWPFNYITRAIYEISRGYRQIGPTHYYVSNGFGTWGPPVRIGNRPEIVQITLKFLH